MKIVKESLNESTNFDVLNEIIDNFKDITGEDISTIYNDVPEGPIFDDSAIDRTSYKIVRYLTEHGVSSEDLDEYLYELDNRLSAYLGAHPELIESLNEEKILKPWHYTEDEIYDVAYNLMMNGYLDGWEAADIKSALLYADEETIGDAPYIFTMDEEDEDDGWDRWDVEPSRDDWDTDEDIYVDESLNENMNNMDKVLDSDVANPVTSIPPTMTDAIEKNNELEKNAEDIKKEQEKILNNKRYFLGAKDQPTPKDPEEPKQLTLDESLFNEDAKEILYVIVDKHGNQLSRPISDDNELWDRVESRDPDGKRGLRVVVYKGNDIDESININESSFSFKPLYEQAENIADYLSEFLDLVSRVSNLEDYLDEYDLDHLGKAMDALYDFAQMYSDAAGVNEAVKPGTKLGPRKSKLPKEKEKREKLDAWSTVMEELVPSDILYKFKEVTKFPDIRPKARYDADAISVDYDGNVEIYADNVDKFDFAKKVAEAYGLKTEEPKARIKGNGFTMKIYMPEVKDE